MIAAAAVALPLMVKTAQVAFLRVERAYEEMALVDGRKRSADAIALDDAEVVAIREKQFLFLVSQTPYFALSVMAVMARRLRAMNKLDA